jgi:hypothetical protein
VLTDEIDVFGREASQLLPIPHVTAVRQHSIHVALGKHLHLFLRIFNNYAHQMGALFYPIVQRLSCSPGIAP